MVDTPNTDKQVDVDTPRQDIVWKTPLENSSNGNTSLQNTSTNGDGSCQDEVRWGWSPVRKRAVKKPVCTWSWAWSPTMGRVLVPGNGWSWSPAQRLQWSLYQQGRWSWSRGRLALPHRSAYAGSPLNYTYNFPRSSYSSQRNSTWRPGHHRTGAESQTELNKREEEEAQETDCTSREKHTNTSLLPSDEPGCSATSIGSYTMVNSNAKGNSEVEENTNTEVNSNVEINSDEEMSEPCDRDITLNTNSSTSSKFTRYNNSPERESEYTESPPPSPLCPNSTNRTETPTFEPDNSTSPEDIENIDKVNGSVQMECLHPELRLEGGSNILPKEFEKESVSQSSDDDPGRNTHSSASSVTEDEAANSPMSVDVRSPRSPMPENETDREVQDILPPDCEHDESIPPEEDDLASSPSSHSQQGDDQMETSDSEEPEGKQICEEKIKVDLLLSTKDNQSIPPEEDDLASSPSSHSQQGDDQMDTSDSEEPEGKQSCEEKIKEDLLLLTKDNQSIPRKKEETLKMPLSQSYHEPDMLQTSDSEEEEGSEKGEKSREENSSASGRDTHDDPQESCVEETDHAEPGKERENIRHLDVGNATLPNPGFSRLKCESEIMSEKEEESAEEEENAEEEKAEQKQTIRVAEKEGEENEAEGEKEYEAGEVAGVKNNEEKEAETEEDEDKEAEAEEKEVEENEVESEEEKDEEKEVEGEKDNEEKADTEREEEEKAETEEEEKVETEEEKDNEEKVDTEEEVETEREENEKVETEREEEEEDDEGKVETGDEEREVETKEKDQENHLHKYTIDSSKTMEDENSITKKRRYSEDDEFEYPAVVKKRQCIHTQSTELDVYTKEQRPLYEDSVFRERPSLSEDSTLDRVLPQDGTLVDDPEISVVDEENTCVRKPATEMDVNDEEDMPLSENLTEDALLSNEEIMDANSEFPVLGDQSVCIKSPSPEYDAHYKKQKPFSNGLPQVKVNPEEDTMDIDSELSVVKEKESIYKPEEPHKKTVTEDLPHDKEDIVDSASRSNYKPALDSEDMPFSGGLKLEGAPSTEGIMDTTESPVVSEKKKRKGIRKPVKRLRKAIHKGVGPGKEKKKRVRKATKKLRRDPVPGIEALADEGEVLPEEEEILDNAEAEAMLSKEAILAYVKNFAIRSHTSQLHRARMETRAMTQQLARRTPNHGFDYVAGKRDEVFKAAEEGLVERVRELAQDTGVAIRHGAGGGTLLHAAAGRGQLDVVLSLLPLISPNTVDHLGRTPAHVAALGGHTQVLRLLLADQDFDLTICDNTGRTYKHLLSRSLAEAVVQGQRGRALELLRLGADPDSPDIDSVDSSSADANNPDGSGADPDSTRGNTTASHGTTPRQMAEVLQQEAMVDLFQKVKPMDREARDTEESSEGVSLQSLAAERTETKVEPPAVHTAATVLPSGPDVYSMTSEPRGYVCILSYGNFKDRPDLHLGGARYGAQNLAGLFCDMGYTGQAHFDLTAEQTKKELLNVRSSGDLEGVNCAIFYISSHGTSSGHFLTSDRKVVSNDWVYNAFQDSYCPGLKGKPKLFIFDLCYGHCNGEGNREEGLGVRSRVTEPLRDTAVLYSSCGGVTWYTYSECGSMFTSTLCETLAHLAPHKELYDIYRHLVTQCTSTDPTAAPHLLNIAFTKKFYFSPKYTTK